AQVGKVPIERRGGALAGLLDRVDRELDRDAAGITDAVAHALRELEVMPVARRQVATGLRDADHRTVAAMQLVECQAEVHLALEVERGHAGIVGIVEPGAGSQGSLGLGVAGHVGAVERVRAAGGTHSAAVYRSQGGAASGSAPAAARARSSSSPVTPPPSCSECTAASTMWWRSTSKNERSRARVSLRPKPSVPSVT